MNNFIEENIKDYLLSLNLLGKDMDYKEYIRLLYILSNNYIKNYKVFRIRKHNGKMRTIYEPIGLLKIVNRNILHNYLEEKKVNEAARAYRKGYGLKDNCLVHVGKKIILKLDIKHFFDSISFNDVYNCCFRELPESVGVLLTNLCCYADFLPQGAPASACISNIFMNDFDRVVSEFCNQRMINYTRYSDDLTFSGDFNIQEVIDFVKKELKKKHLLLNNEKIRIIRNNKKQFITGLVCNDKVNVDKSKRKKIRQEVYYIKKYGLNSHCQFLEIHDSSKYLESLIGRVRFILQISETSEFKKYLNFLEGLKNN